MTKKIFIILITIASAVIISYGLYMLYIIVMTDIEQRLTAAIAQGIREGLGSAVNPIHWAKSLMQE